MTKKELLELLKNINDDAVILFGKNDYSDYIATEVYVKINEFEPENTEVLITNHFIHSGHDCFEKII